MVQVRLAALLLVTLAGCTGGGSTACQTPLDPPEGFTQRETFEEESEDHIGVRLSYQDERDRLLHAAAGIPGEWGERLPLAGEIPLADGGTGQVLSGVENTWMLIWELGGVCDPRVVIANGFSRAEFVTMLIDVGIANEDAT